MTTTNPINNNERVKLPEPTWTQREKTGKIAGITLIALGILGIIASIAAIVAGAIGSPFGGVALIVGGSVGLAASITALAMGIFLVRKESWNDPVFVDRMAEQSKTMTFDQIMDRFGPERTSQFQFITKDEVTAKVLQKATDENLSYSQITKVLRDANFKAIDWRALKPLLMAEIDRDKLSVQQFKDRFGDQPIINQVVDGNDPWLVGTLNEEIKGKSYADLLKYGSLLSKEAIKEELIRQYQSTPFIEFWNKHNVTLMICNGLFNVEFFQEKANAEIATMSIAEFLQRCKWGVFQSGILNGAQFSNRFTQEVVNLPFSQIFNTYGWTALDVGMATTQLYHDKAHFEVSGMTFDQILRNYGWDIFERKVLSGDDPYVRDSFVAFAKSVPFSTFWPDYEKSVINFNLLNNAQTVLGQQLWNQLTTAESEYKKQLSVNRFQYSATVGLEKRKAEMSKTTAENAMNAAIIAYNRHYKVNYRFDRHHRRIDTGNQVVRTFVNCALRAQYEAAIANYVTVCEMSDQIYAQAVAIAENNKNALDQQALAQFNASKGQIDQTFFHRLG